MAKKITQRDLKHDEFADAVFDFGHWLEENWSRVLKWVGLALVLVVAGLAIFAWSQRAKRESRLQLARAIERYEQARAAGGAEEEGFRAALETLNAVASKAGGGPGRVARFYRGATLYRLGRLDEARDDLQAVVAEVGAAETLGATAQMLLARVEVAAGRTDEAVKLLEGLAGQGSAAVAPDVALLELGRIHSNAGREDEARRQWQRIVDEFPQSASVAEARTLLDS